MAQGLTPVNWTGSTWTEVPESKWDYNYKSVAKVTHESIGGNGSGKWANAKTADGSLYVWIPRYSYKIVSGEHTKNVDSWNSDNITNSQVGKISIKFSQGIKDDTSNGYIAHPAFSFGNDELTGFWVAKYEASRNDATNIEVGSGTIPTFKPGVKAWISREFNEIFNSSYNLNRNLESHLMKNNE